MNTEPHALDALFESVGKGNPIDVSRLEAASLHETRRRLLRHLSMVSDVSQAPETQGDDGTDDEPSLCEDFPFPERPARRWGHLLLLEKIGAGAYADVYRGYDIRLGIEVAVKLLKPRPGENTLSRLLHEARALARVRHEHVVSVHGASVHDGCAGLWMELVRGRTLGERLRARGPFPAAEAMRIGRQLCAALGAVHDAGVVHGDIKTENIMQESDGRMVLMDFGASQLADGPPRDAGPAGTPLYLAPEALDGDETTIHSDIYAIGVLLYRLVTGSYPVNALSLEGLKAAHATGEYHSLRDARPDLPAGFVAVVDRALEPNPDDRFPTVRAMEKALTPPRRRTRWHVALADRATGRPSRKPRRTAGWREVDGHALAFGWSRA